MDGLGSVLVLEFGSGRIVFLGTDLDAIIDLRSQ